MDYRDTPLSEQLQKVLARKEGILQTEQTAMEHLAQTLNACEVRIRPLKQKLESIQELLRENETFCAQFQKTCLALYKTLRQYPGQTGRSEECETLEQELLKTQVLSASFAEAHEKTVLMLGNATEPCFRRREQLEQLRQDTEAELSEVYKKMDVLKKLLSISQHSCNNQRNEIDHLRTMLDDLTK